jgi:hypothetical protein
MGKYWNQPRHIRKYNNKDILINKWNRSSNPFFIEDKIDELIALNNQDYSEIKRLLHKLRKISDVKNKYWRDTLIEQIEKIKQRIKKRNNEIEDLKKKDRQTRLHF